jgi:hypothetical protein
MQRSELNQGPHPEVFSPAGDFGIWRPRESGVPTGSSRCLRSAPAPGAGTTDSGRFHTRRAEHAASSHYRTDWLDLLPLVGAYLDGRRVPIVFT